MLLYSSIRGQPFHTYIEKGDSMRTENRFSKTIENTGHRIKGILNALPQTIKNNTEEIRLRVGLPIALTVNGDTVFVEESGKISFSVHGKLPIATATDIAECYRLLCGNSAYAHGEELKEGYIIMKNGNRAGICGTVTESGFIKDVTSINIRIAHEIEGAANSIVKQFTGENLLIAGPPGCGKTTILRDLIRQLSSGANGKYYRTAVIDSRGELSGSYKGDGGCDLGAVTDIILTKDKAKGIETALRTMFPEIIAFDEIGTTAELKALSESMFSGVSVITTAHIGSKNELLSRSITRSLINEGIISKIAILPSLHGGAIQIFSARELLSRVAV